MTRRIRLARHSLEARTRDADIIARRARGESLNSIAEHWGISTPHVCIICNRGVALRDRDGFHANDEALDYDLAAAFKRFARMPAPAQNLYRSRYEFQH